MGHWQNSCVKNLATSDCAPGLGISSLLMDIAEAVEQESDTRVNSPERLSFLFSYYQWLLKGWGIVCRKSGTLTVN